MKLKNNLSLALLLLLLVLASLGLTFWEKGSSGPQVDPELFAIENIDPIDRVVITHQGQVIDGRAFSGGFLINDKFAMDGNLLTLLAAVLQQVRVQRPLGGQQQERLWQNIQENGSHVEVYAGEQLLSSFWASGDEAKEQSFFATEDGKVYLVNLPGYTSYVSGLFELPLSDWRSRVVFSNTWRSLMSVNFQDFTEPDNDFQITYNDPFFAVSGVQRLDSNHVMNYLQELVNLKAAALVDTSYQGMPWLELTTTDIDPNKNQTLTLYGDSSQSVVLGQSGEQFFTFSRNSIEGLRRNEQYFSRQ
jgi:hypothetical protein